MSKELVISANRHETRVAVLEDDQVVEVFYQRENEYSLAGSIHKGRVTRVLPGMQSAFVDIGLGRDAFLYVSDFFEDNDEYDKIVTSVEEKVLKLDRAPVAPVQASPVEAAPEPASAAAADGVAVPVDVVPAAPLSPPASAMQGPPDSRETAGATVAAIAAATAAEIAAATGVAIRAETGAAGVRAADADSAAAAAAVDAACRRPNTIRRGPTANRVTSRRSPPESPRRFRWRNRVSQPRVVFDPEQDDFFVLPGESLAKYTGGHAEDEPDEQSGSRGSARSRIGENRGDEAPSDAAFETDDSLEGATQRMLAAAEAAEAAQGQEPVADRRCRRRAGSGSGARTGRGRGSGRKRKWRPNRSRRAGAAIVAEEPAAAPAEAEASPIQVVSLETGFVAVETESPEAGESEAAETADGEAAAELTERRRR